MIPRPSLSLGIEEEYQIIDPETREMKSFITQFIGDDGKVVMIERDLKPELHQSMVELGTPVCPTVDALKEELIKQRSFIIKLAEDKGFRVVAAATHPFSRWRDQPVTPLPRYQGVLEDMQMLAQRLLIFGMHVHVGIEDRAFTPWSTPSAFPMAARSGGMPVRTISILPSNFVPVTSAPVSMKPSPSPL